MIFLLVSARIDRLLPTIRSRCRQWPMPTPSSEVASQWLAAQRIEDAPAALAEAGGAPLAALALAGDEHRALRRWMLDQLALGPACDAFGCGETLQKVPMPVVLGWLQRWLYDLLAQQTAMSGTPRLLSSGSRCACALCGASRAAWAGAFFAGRQWSARGGKSPAQCAIGFRGIVFRLSRHFHGDCF